MKNPFKRSKMTEPDNPQNESAEQGEAQVVDMETGTASPPPSSPANDAAQKLLRLQADFDNFRRRNQAAKQEAREEARREVLEALLPVYDNFLRALDHAQDEEDYSPFATGIEGIRMQFEEFFRRQGLEPIAAEEGDPFDPNLHEATGTLPGTDEQDGSVAKELRRGFKHKNQVLRPAQVLVFTR